MMGFRLDGEVLGTHRLQGASSLLRGWMIQRCVGTVSDMRLVSGPGFYLAGYRRG